jgi:hypothetical protein
MLTNSPQVKKTNYVTVVYWLEFLATDPEVRVLFPALPDFLRSSGSGTGCSLRSYLKERVAAPIREAEITAYTAPSNRKSWH